MGLRVVGSRTPFRDRSEAGRLLADALAGEVAGDVLVLGIPRGGVVIGSAVARQLGAALDVVIARKLSAPGDPELAIGAVIEDGRTHLNCAMVETIAVDEAYIAQETERQLEQIRRRAAAYRAVRPIAPREGRSLIVVDDGVATGATMIATLSGLRAAKPAAIWAAVPVGPEDTLHELTRWADEVVCLAAPAYFPAVGIFYEQFDQVEDAEVIGILKSAKSAG